MAETRRQLLEELEVIELRRFEELLCREQCASFKEGLLVHLSKKFKEQQTKTFPAEGRVFLLKCVGTSAEEVNLQLVQMRLERRAG